MVNLYPLFFLIPPNFKILNFGFVSQNFFTPYSSLPKQGSKTYFLIFKNTNLDFQQKFFKLKIYHETGFSKFF